MTADELAAKVSHHMLSQEGTGPAFGISIVEVREGYARITMTVRPDMLNGHGTVHGGMLFLLADTAFAYACNSRNITTVSQHAAMTFMAPAHLGDVLFAEAREMSIAGRTGAYVATVRTEDGRVIAEFNGLAKSIGGPVLEVE